VPHPDTSADRSLQCRYLSPVPHPDVAVVFPQAHQRGGVERIAWDLMHHLVHQGRSVAFVGEQLAIGASADIEHVHVAPARGLPRPLAFRRAAVAVLAKLGPTNTITLGANCPPGDILMVQSVHRSWLRSARTVPFAGHDIPAAVRYLMPRHQVLLGLEQAYFRSERPRAVLCCSSREASDLKALYGVAAGKLHVVPNGYDPAVFHPCRAADRAAIRRQMGVTDNDVVLLLMANELHRKGFGPLVQAVAADGDPRLRVAVVGKADIASYAGELAALGLTDRVRWYGPTSDAAAWYAACDVLTLPTQYEPFGLVIVEALATGLPVITTRLAGASDAVQPGVNGLLQDDPYDVAELAGLLHEALDDPTRARWASSAAGSVKRFQHETVFQQVVDQLT